MDASIIKNLTITKETMPIISELAECMPGGFFIYHADEDEKIIYANDKLSEIYRCKNKKEFLEYVNNSFKGMVKKEELANCEKEIAEQIKNGDGTIDHVRYTILRKDGTEGKLDDYGYKTHSENYGDVFCVFINDVSNSAENENLHTVVSSLSDDYKVLFHIDFVTGKEDFFLAGDWIQKDRIEEFSKLPYDSKVEYFSKKYIVSEDQKYFEQSTKSENALAVINAGKPLVVRFRMKSNTKEEWYELKAVHHAEHVGKKCAIVGIRNVDEEVQRQADVNENALRDRKHLLSLHDIIHSGMWNIILDNKCENILDVQWSDAYRHLLGYTDEKDFPNVFSAWYEKLHPEDKDRALELFWKGAKPGIGEGAFDTDFRLLNKNGNYYWYHVASRLEQNKDGTYLYFGIFVDSTAEHKNAEYQAIQKQNLDIIQILASEYTSVYYIDLNTDDLNPYTMNKETESEFGQIFNSGISYSDAFKMYVDKLILSEDKQMMLKEGSIENIKDRLKNQKTFITRYRSSDNRYNEMKFVKVGGDNDEPIAVALGFADRDEEIRKQMTIDQERQRNFDIIEILASEYSSVYYIDLTTDELNPYTMNAETETTFGSVFRSGIKYSEAYDLYVDKLILSDDKKMMLEAGSIDNIIKELSSKKTFITRYRSSDNHYNEMKFVKVGGDNDKPVAVALGFADRDEEIRKQMATELERQRNYDIIQILASEYTSVYYIDLNTDDLNPYTMNKETESEFGQIFNSGIKYSEAYDLYVDKLILSDDKKMMLEAGSIKNIKDQLKNQKTFITRYRSSDNRYNEMKFVKVGGDNDEPTAVALGFADRDEEIRNQMATELERQRNFDIIEILASEYTSVYYINLNTDELNPYTMNAETETTFGSVFRSGIKYSEAYDLYVDKLILSDDKKMMLEAGSIDNIRKELSSKKTFITRYRSSDNHYNEMKFVKVGGDNDKPVAVALGFADRDEEIRKQMAIELERQRNYDIIEILASEYSSVYYIDLTTDELNPYTMNADTESAFGKIFRSGIKYSAAYRMYVDQLILPEDKPMMLKAGSVGNIMKELHKKKTFLTTYRNAEGHYSEMKFVKVGNEDGLPTAVALGFADKDEELRAKQEEQLKLQRNIDIIEILASEYTSVYYIDLTTDELDPYTMNADTESAFGKIFRSGIHYSDAFKMYVDTLVYSSDKKMMLKAGSIYNILKELSTKKTFITTYQNVEGHYCEMKFVKVGDAENPQAVALGFADKDQEIRVDMARKENAERDAAVISGLADDFGCVVYASYSTFDEVQYRIDPLFEKNIPGWSKIHNFYDRLDKLTNTIMHPDDRAAFWAATRPDVVHKMVDKENVYFVNFRTLIDGNITYYQCKFAKDEQHKDTHVIAGFHNVDAETKREMDALDKANLASRAKTDFLFNMSHDIRTPMNAIIGFTNMAIRDIDNREKAIQNLEKVRMSSDMLLSLINDILDMSRIESGKVKLNEDPFTLDDTFKKIEPVMADLAKRKDIDITFDKSNVQDKHNFVDITRLERVLVNLISNAIKYTPNGGRVQVVLEQLGKISEKEGMYRFIIADNGIGMSEEFQKHMFEEFAREENSTVSGIQGTGLGLALAQKLVKLMRGDISCASKRGEGSTFTITIPFRLQDIEDIQKKVLDDSKKVDSIVLKGKKVLLADDNDLNREIATCILEDESMIVETAVNGEDAANKVISKGKDYYDFILMDIQMPVMDGYTATAKIRKAIPNLVAPIIALSANAFEEDKKKSLEAGMNGHIAKPIDVQELFKALCAFYSK